MGSPVKIFRPPASRGPTGYGICPRSELECWSVGESCVSLKLGYPKFGGYPKPRFPQ